MRVQKNTGADINSSTYRWKMITTSTSFFDRSMRRSAEPLGVITCLLKHNSILFLSLSPQWFCKGNASDEFIFTLPRTRPAIIHRRHAHAILVIPQFSTAPCFSRSGYGGAVSVVGWPPRQGARLLPFWWWRRRYEGSRGVVEKEERGGHTKIEFTPSPWILLGWAVSKTAKTCLL